MPPARSPLVLALDLGTSSVRTALFDVAGHRLAGSLQQIEHSVRQAEAGMAEFDALAIEREVLACLKKTLARTGGRPVATVGVSCFWHSLLGTDAKGKVVTPIYSWADSRCREDAAALRNEMREADYHARTGCMLRVSFWPAKLRWFARTSPRLFARVARWQSPADWLAGQWCDDGDMTTAPGMATGTGLFDPRKLDWDDALLKKMNITREQLARIDSTPLRVSAKFARLFPALAEAQWWPAVGDGAASNLGSGATQTGRAAVNVGTSAAFRVMSAGVPRKVPFGLFCYRVDEERCVIGGAVSNAGNLRAWCRRELRLSANDAELDRALAARPGPLRSLVTLPFWSAERAPTWCEDLGGVVQGLSQGTTALDLVQATTEAVYHRLALIADLSLGKCGAAEIIVSGGVLKSSTLLQRLSDVLGRAVRPGVEPEASLRGAVVYALERSGWATPALSDIRHLAGKAVRPRKKYAREYAHERERQQRLEATIAAAK